MTIFVVLYAQGTLIKRQHSYTRLMLVNL